MAVTDGDWNSGELVTASNDRTLTLSVANGDTKMQSHKLNAEPQFVQWGKGVAN